MNTTRRHRSRPPAFTLLEALLLVMILGITGAAAGRAIISLIHSPDQNNAEFLVDTALVDKTEYLRSLPFVTLVADIPRSPSLYTDVLTIDNTVMTRTVSITYVSPATGLYSNVATHMLQIAVTLNGKTLSTLVNEP